MDCLKTYKTIDIAYYIDKLCKQNNFESGKTKINKLLYFAYGMMLAEYNHRMTEERPHYWKYGPVFPSANNKIEKMDTLYKTEEPFIDDKTKEILNIVVLNWGMYKAQVLTKMTHEKGTPWYNMQKNNLKFNETIRDEEIKEYFENTIYEKHNIPANFYKDDDIRVLNSVEELFDEDDIF